MPNDLPDWVANASLPAGTFTINSAQSNVSPTITLPGRAPAVVLDVLTSTFTQLTVTGHTSGEVYISQASPLVGPLVALITDGRDATLDCSFSHTIGGGNDVVDVSFLPLATVALLSLGSKVDVTDRLSRVLGRVTLIDSGGTFVGTVGNPLSTNNIVPAQWQAPTAVAKAEVGNGVVANYTLVAAVALQVIRVFYYELEFDVGTGPIIAFLRDDSPSRFAVLSGNPNDRVAVGVPGGIPLPVARGLQLEVALAGAGGNVRAFVAYSQA